jgi:hypothetical protein
MINRLKNKLKVWGWKLAAAALLTLAILIYLYKLLRPESKVDIDGILSTTQVRIREEEIKAELEKEKIKAIKDIYKDRLKKSEEIEDKEERLKELIRIYEELNNS